MGAEMDFSEVRVKSVVVLKKNTWQYKFKHRRNCRFFRNINVRYWPVVRISRIALNSVFGFGKEFWFKKMCGCFPATHIHKIKTNGRLRIVKRKTSCLIPIQNCEPFQKVAH